MVRSIDAVHPQAVFETGDLIDNDQQNEMDQASAMLRGGRVDPNSGSPGYDGVQDESNADPLIYRPAVDAPRYPRLLAHAERRSPRPACARPGTRCRETTTCRCRGTCPPRPATERVAVGERKLRHASTGATLRGGARGGRSTAA